MKPSKVPWVESNIKRKGTLSPQLRHLCQPEGLRPDYDFRGLCKAECPRCGQRSRRHRRPYRGEGAARNCAKEGETGVYANAKEVMRRVGSRSLHRDRRFFVGA